MNQSEFLGAFRIDLSQRYYSLLHDMTIAKLQAYVLKPLSANFEKCEIVLKGLMGDYLAFR